MSVGEVARTAVLRAEVAEREAARLRRALSDLRERVNIAERRCRLLEDSQRTAYRLAAWGGRATP